MKLCMNLNLRNLKQNYYLTSLNYVVTILFSFSCIKQRNYFFQKIFYSFCIYCLLSQRFLYLMMVKLTKVRNNLFEEINRQWDCIVSKNTCFQQILTGTKKKSKKNFSMVKEYGRHKVSNIQILIFIAVCVVVFLTSIFLF